MDTEYSEKDKEEYINLSAELKALEKTNGWSWLLNKLNKDKEDLLDILVKDDTINNIDFMRGKIKYIKDLLENIKTIHTTAARMQEEGGI